MGNAKRSCQSTCTSFVHLSKSTLCTLSVLRMATTLRVRGAGKSSKSRGGGAAHGLLHWLRSQDVALSKAVFTRFGHTHGRGRRCVQRCASRGVTVNPQFSHGNKQHSPLSSLPIRGFKAVERLGQGYLWFGVPIVILLVSHDSGLRRDAATWLFAMLVDLVTIAGIKVRSLPRRLCVFYVRLTSCSTGRCASTTAFIQCARYVGHQRRQVLLPERWVPSHKDRCSAFASSDGHAMHNRSLITRHFDHLPRRVLCSSVGAGANTCLWNAVRDALMRCHEQSRLVALPVGIWACTTAASRVAMGRHYVADVVVGCLLGLVELQAVLRLMPPLCSTI